MDPNLRALVARLVPSAAMHCPPQLVDLGPIRELALRDGALVFVFAGGLEMRFALEGQAWAALLEFMLRQEPLVPGTTDADTFRRLAELVGAVPHFDA